MVPAAVQPPLLPAVAPLARLAQRQAAQRQAAQLPLPLALGSGHLPARPRASLVPRLPAALPRQARCLDLLPAAQRFHLSARQPAVRPRLSSVRRPAALQRPSSGRRPAVLQPLLVPCLAQRQQPAAVPSGHSGLPLLPAARSAAPPAAPQAALSVHSALRRAALQQAPSGPPAAPPAAPLVPLALRPAAQRAAAPLGRPRRHQRPHLARQPSQQAACLARRRRLALGTPPPQVRARHAAAPAAAPWNHASLQPASRVLTPCIAAPFPDSRLWRCGQPVCLWSAVRLRRGVKPAGLRTDERLWRCRRPVCFWAGERLWRGSQSACVWAGVRLRCRG